MENKPKIRKKVLLKKYTTFKVGGPAEYFCIVDNEKELLKAVEFAKEKRLSVFILGNGSNVLFDDKGFSGLVIKINLDKITLEKNILSVEAGVFLPELIDFCRNKSLSGLEWSAGIPGTVGGAVFGNAGSFGKSMKDTVKEVRVFDLKDKKIKTLKKKDCQFSYRESVFKRKKNWVIISATLCLKKGNKETINRKIREYLSQKKKKQPLNFPSAGSVFKNPGKFSAAELIEKAGLKGKTVGGSKVSEKHSNFIVNFRSASAKDIKELIKIIKKEIKIKFKINLEEEIIIL